MKQILLFGVMILLLSSVAYAVDCTQLYAQRSIAGGPIQNLNAADECVATLLVNPTAGSLTNVEFSWAALSAGDSLDVTIWDDDGDGGRPGTYLGDIGYINSVVSAPSNSTSEGSVTLTSGDYWVSLCQDADGGGTNTFLGITPGQSAPSGYSQSLDGGDTWGSTSNYQGYIVAYSCTVPGDETDPVVSLNSPSNNAVSPVVNVPFQATLTDNVKLANATFFMWYSNGSTYKEVDYTISSNVTLITNVSFSTYDTYKWNYRAQDNSSNVAYNLTNYTYTYQNIAYNASFTYPTPANATKNNTVMTINVSCNPETTAYLYYGTSNPPTTLVLTNSTTKTYATPEVDGKYYFKAGCYDIYSGRIEGNTTVREWTLDTTEPPITLNPSNSFTVNNVTAQPVPDLLNLNITVSDNIGLFGFQLLIMRNTTVIMNYTNESLGGIASFNFLNVSNVSHWPTSETGVQYNVTISASDTHTAKAWGSKSNVKKLTKGMEIKTDEGITIIIESDDAATYSSYKEKDRISWTVEHDDKKKKDRVTNIRSERKIHYFPNSPYPGHFIVSSDGVSGNWIDFNSAECTDLSVKKINDYHYQVTCKNSPSKATFNSIGGLNVNTKRYIYTRNSYETPIIDGTPTINTVSLLPSIATNTTDLLGYLNASTYNETLFPYVYFDYIWYRNGEIFNSTSPADIISRELINGTNAAALVNSENMFDMDADTYGYQVAGYGTYMFLNYSNLDSIQGNWTLTIIDGAVTENRTIPADCYLSKDGGSIDLLYSFYSIGGTNKITYYCKNGTSSSYSEMRKTGTNVLYESYLVYPPFNHTPTQYINSSRLQLISTLPAENTQINDEWIFSARAYSNGNYSEWVNSSTVAVLDIGVGICDGNYTYPFLNVSIYDQGDMSPLAADISYDLIVEVSEWPTDFELQGTQSSTSDIDFCTNLDYSLDFSTYGSMTLKSSGYVTEIYEIPSLNKYESATSLPYYLNISMISLNSSSIVIYNWFTDSYTAITGTMEIYECIGDGSRLLVDSLPIISGVVYGNIELISKSYSYEVIYDGERYSDYTDYSKCHIETESERTYYIEVGSVLALPFIELISIDCNVTSVGENIVKLEWESSSSSATLTACIFADRMTPSGFYQIYENCTTTGNSITRTIPNNGNQYIVNGKIYQSGYIKQCGEVAYYSDNDASVNFGIMGVFFCVLLIMSFILFFAGEGEKPLIAGVVAYILAAFVGLLAFNYMMVVGIMFIVAMVIVVVRVTK